MKLENPTDDQLNVAFAENVAGWKLKSEYFMSNPPKFAGKSWTSDGKWMCLENELPPFATSADAVLPWLEKDHYDFTIYYSQTCCMWTVELMQRFTGKESYKGESDETFPKAAVIALLRAHRVEVEFTS